MKRVYVEEQWCLGCHLCEYNCAFANSGLDNMAKALKDKEIRPRIHIEDGDCQDAICMKSCIAGAISKKDGVVCIDKNKCVGCYTCVLVCPYGALRPSPEGPMEKCELCVNNSCGEPACVAGCPNRAIIFAEKEGA